jgi:hypothetical protein
MIPDESPQDRSNENLLVSGTSREISVCNGMTVRFALHSTKLQSVSSRFEEEFSELHVTVIPPQRTTVTNIADTFASDSSKHQAGRCSFSRRSVKFGLVITDRALTNYNE